MLSKQVEQEANDALVEINRKMEALDAKLTREKAGLWDRVSIVRAFLAGASVEYFNKRQLDNSWRNATTPCWDWKHFEYRIKPEPKLRPWTKDEAIGKKIRSKDLGTASNYFLVVAADDHSVRYALVNSPTTATASMQELHNNFETVDGKPCGVRVD